MLGHQEPHDPLWTVNRKNGTYQMLSETLLITFKNFLHSYKGTNQLLVEPVNFNHLYDFLAPGGHNSSIFQRFDIREEDGSYCRITSHQFRHWLNDIADKGGLPVDVQTRWMGRKHAKDTEAYLHSTVEERLQWVKNGIRNGEMQGSMARVYFELPEYERDEFLEGQVQAVHITPMGVCIHDFAVEPRPYYLNCVRGCPEYLRTKGDQRERTYLIQIKRRTEKALEALNEQAVAENTETSQSWIQHYKETLAGVDAALSVDDDSTVKDGIIVKPFVGNPSRFRPLSN
jgi:hypothetical protein